MRFKKLYLIISIFIFHLLFISSTIATSLKPVRLSADSLKKHSTSLLLPWKYHWGDDFEWAKAGFDDEDWDTVRTAIPTIKPVFDLFEGMGWFRRTIIIDSSLMNKAVAFHMWHYGASQIYLNGKLVHEFGKVANNISEEKIYQPRNIPISLLFGKDSVNVLAVRYSNFHATKDKGWYKKWFNYAGFKVRISEINSSILNSVHSEGITLSVNIGISAIFLALAFLYFILFFFYSMKKENLYYSLFTLFISLSFLLQMLTRFNHSNLEFFIIDDFLRSMVTIFIFPSYLAFLYSIFYKKFPKQFWLFIITAITMSFISYYLSRGYEKIFNYLIFGYVFITTVEGLRIIIVAIKTKKENAKILGIGVTIFVIFVITMFVIGLMGKGNINSLWGVILFFLGLISLPTSMSVYLARNIAVTNRELEQQIVTVKELSAKQIEQERKNAELKLQAELAEAENQRKTKELEEARELQLSMLPKKLPKLPNLDIAVYMKTATEVGGDYYDFHVNIDGTLTVVLGDATGHGMKAGTMVTATKSLFSSYAGQSDILSIFHEMTRCLKDLNFHMLSMCLAMIKIKDNKITLSSAGIPPILIFRKNENKVEELIIKGMPLGTIDKFPYQIVESQINSGDTILLMSDGFPELMNGKNQMYGYHHVTEFFEQIARNEPEEIIDKLIHEIDLWKNGSDPNDDVTFVVIKIK